MRIHRCLLFCLLAGYAQANDLTGVKTAVELKNGCETSAIRMANNFQ